MTGNTAAQRPPLPARTTISGLRALCDPAGHSHIISLVDPDWAMEPGLFEAWRPERRLLLSFHDEVAPAPGRTLPSRGDAVAILDFARSAESAEGEPPRFFIHCLSGVSRSTAAALMIWAQAAPERDEAQVMAELERRRPGCWPNSLMVLMADERLGRQGRLSAALQDYFRRRTATDPALEERMRRLRRGPDLSG